MAGSGGDESEPRFAGSAPAGYQPQVAYAPAPTHFDPGLVPSRAPVPASPSPADPTPSWPEVSYSGAAAPSELEVRAPQLQAWFAPLLAAVGAILAIVGSQLKWVTLRQVDVTVDPSSGDQQPSNIRYDGMDLLEGRVILVLGVVALIFSVLILLRRRLEISLAVTGAAGLATALLAAAAHPVELSTLFDSYDGIGGIKVQLPNGPGVWLAIAGSVVIVGGGLLAYIWRDRPDLRAIVKEQPDE